MKSNFTKTRCWLAVITVLNGLAIEAGEIDYFTHQGDYRSYATKTERTDLAFTRQILAKGSGLEDFGSTEIVKKLRSIAELQDATLEDVARLNIYIAMERPDLRTAAEKLVTDHWLQGKTPAVSIVPGKLPDGAALGLDAVIVLESRSDQITPIKTDASIAPAKKGIVFASGRVAKGINYAESIPVVHELIMADVKHLGVREKDIVSVRAYINDVDNWAQAEAEIEALFGERSSPIVFIEWSRGDAVEVEYIFSTPEIAIGQPAVIHFPNTPKASPSFSRGAVVNATEIIFMGAMFGEPGDPENEVTTLLKTVMKNAKATGSDVDHLAKTTYFVNDSEVNKATGPVRPKFYNPDTPPAASKIARDQVGLAGHHISMDMIAVPGEGTDYASLLPPLIPVEPDKVLETFELRDGFRIELVAAEPLIADPVEIAFDERGRLWVLEFSQYNQEFHGGDLSKRGRLKILEDTDGDGRMDKATTFLDDLDYSSAFHPWKDGVYLGRTPDILYIADTNGDGKADHEEVVFTGFSRDKIRAGQAQMNSFRWGFDNRIHVCTNSGGSVRRADNDDQRPVNVLRRGFAFDPVTWQFAVGSGGGQHGQTFDRWGNRFNCQSSRPDQFVIYDSHYLKNNPWMPAPSSSILISDEVKNKRLHVISPPEPWRIVRNKMRVAGEFRGSADIRDGKVQDQGYITSASGLTFYTGDAFPESYLANTFIGEPANNVVYRAEVVRRGLTFLSRRAEPEAEREFLASTDNYFRPVQFANGPDGALYVVDMYREIIEGGGFLPPKVVEHIDMVSGDDRGRIYRLLPQNSVRRALPNLVEKTTGQLVGLLASPNGWHRDTAARLLWQKQDREPTVDALKKLIATTDSALARTRARYLLTSFDAYDADQALAALQENDPDALVHSLRLSDGYSAESEAIREHIIQLGDHADEQIHYQALFSSGEFSHAQKADLLARRLGIEGSSRWIRLAATSAIADVIDEVFDQLYNDSEFTSTKAADSILSELARNAAKSRDLDTIIALVETLTKEQKNAPRQQAALFRSLLLSCDKSVREALISRSENPVRQAVTGAIDQARQISFDPNRAPKQRLKHLPFVALADYVDVGENLKSLLAPNQAADLQSAALDILAKFDSAEIGGFLIESWPGFSPGIRARAIEILLSRPPWAMSTISAVEAGEISRGELGPIRVQTLLSHADSKVSERANQIFGGAEQEARAAVINRYAAALVDKGDPTAGRKVFARACAACHQLDGMGNAIGPRLLGIGSIGREAILQNVLDPNRDVKAEYLNYSLSTNAGETHSGMIQAESTNSVTLRRLDGTASDILRVDIAKLSGMGISFMPVGLENQVDVAAMTDLLAYLVSLD